MKIQFATDDKVLEIPGDSLVAATFDHMNLHRAILEELDMSLASFVKTDLRGALMWKSVLKQANLEQASLIAADLRYAKLQGAVLRNGRAIDCQFDEADICEADLDGVDVGFASFVKARLCGARML